MPLGPFAVYVVDNFLSQLILLPKAEKTWEANSRFDDLSC